MEYRYACDRCGEIHASNPRRCRSCGATVFSPVSVSNLRDRTQDRTIPDSLDPSKIPQVGKSSPDVELNSSPDVTVDGSVKRGESTNTETNEASESNWIKWTVIVVLLVIVAIVVFQVLL